MNSQPLETPSPPCDAPSRRRPLAHRLRTPLLLCLAAGAVIALVRLDWGPVHSVDAGVARWLHARALAHPAWTETNRIFSQWVWDPWTMRALLALAVLWLWLGSRWALGLWCAATAAVGSGVQQALKAVIGRERPRWHHPVATAHYAAMPSGHAMTAAVVCVLLLWLARRAGVGRRVWAAALAAAWVSVAGVSFTRLALGVHWLTDTLAGALLGCAVARLGIALWPAYARGGAGPRRQPGRSRAALRSRRSGADQRGLRA
jgi:membrane-associated phospholipid phosphatase